MDRELMDVTEDGTERQLFDRILKYTGVFGGIQGVTLFISLVVTKVKSLWLGTVGYGISENLNRTTDLIRNSTNLGVATVAVPEISKQTGGGCEATPESILITRSWALLTALAGMIVSIIMAPLLSRWAFGNDGDYTSSFVALSLAVAATAVTGGETAIMRGMGMLRQIALSQLCSGLLSLLVSVPLYWIFKFDGIVPAIVLTALGSMAVTSLFSCRSFAYMAHPFDWSLLRKGTGMIGFGVFFTVAAFMSAWAWSFIARYLTNNGGNELTGTYSAGYMLVTYLSTLLFSVTDSEYYPRLSAAVGNNGNANSIMSSQAAAMTMLSAPIVMLFMICVPIVVYVVLEYDGFKTVVPLAQLAVIGLFFKSASQPVAYMLLARSDSKMYLFQETLCYIFLVLCVVFGFKIGNVIGIGVSLALWEALYLLLTLVVARSKYGFVPSLQAIRNFVVQGVLVVAVGLCVAVGSGMTIVIGSLLCLVSIVVSLRFFASNTTLVPSILSKFLRIKSKH